MRKSRRVRTVASYTPRIRTSTFTTEEEVAEALRAAGGLQSDAATLLNLTQGAVSQRIKKSEYLQEVLQETVDRHLDIAEGALIKKVKRGHFSSICFFLKCKGKSRGYIERSEVVGLHANVPSGVLLLPAPSHDLNDWETLASQWSERPQIEYNPEDDVDIDNEY